MNGWVVYGYKEQLKDIVINIGENDYKYFNPCALFKFTTLSLCSGWKHPLN